MPQQDQEISARELRPDEPGGTLRLVFATIFFMGAGVFLGFVQILLLRRAPNTPLVLMPLAAGLLLSIVFSQVASQIIFFVEFGSRELRFSSPFRKVRLPVDSICSIYLAPNMRYYNIAIETQSAPELLSDALWSRKSFAIVETEFKAWAAQNAIQLSSVSGGWSRTEADRHAAKLILECFRRDYVATLSVLAGMTVFSSAALALLWR